LVEHALGQIGGNALRLFMIAAACALAIGCGQQAPARSEAEALARAEAARPADARLAALYNQSCKTCHAAPDSGAPLALDAAAWAPRWAKGEEALLESTIGGLNAMPAGGQCFACTPEDYRALTAFMAGREGEAR
jgi:cytochrome c5